MKKIYLLPLLLFILLFHNQTALAQGENNHWHFGNHQHLNFNTVPPTFDLNSNILTFESSATVSDAQGNLLFYTIGCRIWDRNGNEMPNATGLLGNGPITGSMQGSSAEGIQVLPNPANTNQYYVFSASASEDGTDSVFYHIVDMSLNGGLGDVLPGSKNTVLFGGATASITEITTTTYGDCNSYWYVVVMGSTLYNGAYYAYKVDENGIATTPVISVPNISIYGITLLQIAHNSPVAYTTSGQSIVRSSFNRSTGQFSNFEIIPTATPVLYLALSPNEELLYTSSGSTINQYNLQLYPNLNSISASGTSIYSGSNQGMALRLAPDGKIYNSGATFATFLPRIEYPDLLGTAATYNAQAIPITSAMSPYSKFGAEVLRRRTIDTIKNVIPQEILCPDDSIVLDSAHPDIVAYKWYDGSTSGTHIINQTGSFWRFAYSSDCKLYIDTFHVALSGMPLSLGNDTIICYGGSYMINAANPGFDSYTWNDGSTEPGLRVNGPGTYYVTVQAGSCQYSDTVKVDAIIPEVYILQADTTICIGSTITVKAGSNMGSDIYWNTGFSGASIPIDAAGRYVASTQNKCGIQSDTLLLIEADCDCVPMVPNSFTPNRDGRNDVFMPVFPASCDARKYEMHIYNRYGQRVFSSFSRDIGWDGTYYQGGKPADAGVYYYIVKITNRYRAGDKPLQYTGSLTLIR